LRYVREHAVRALADINPAAAAAAVIPVMVELIQRPRWPQPALQGALRSTGEKEHVHLSAEEVCRFGPAAVTAMLDAYARHPDKWQFAQDVQALREKQQPAYISHLVKMLSDGDPAQKCDAAEQLGKLGRAAEAAVPALLAALQDPACLTKQTTAGDFTFTTYDYVRARAARALAVVNPAAATTAVVPVLRELAGCPSVLTLDANGDCVQTDNFPLTPEEAALLHRRGAWGRSPRP
jgi:HEAT repeat protein